MIEITLNGEARQFEPATNVGLLLEELGYAGKRVAVEKNGVIVPKSHHSNTPVEEGDRIEIVVAVGGG